MSETGYVTVFCRVPPPTILARETFLYNCILGELIFARRREVRAGIWGERNPAIGLSFCRVIFWNSFQVEPEPEALSFEAGSSHASFEEG